jgi:hypothetical protein
MGATYRPNYAIRVPIDGHVRKTPQVPFFNELSFHPFEPPMIRWPISDRAVNASQPPHCASSVDPERAEYGTCGLLQVLEGNRLYGNASLPSIHRL